MISRGTQYEQILPSEQAVKVPAPYSLRHDPDNVIPPTLFALDQKVSGGPRPCSLETRRQNHFISTDKMLAAEAFKDTDNDKLPIVELRPFTQKEWRPAKSFPDAEADAMGSGMRSSALSVRSHDFESSGYPDIDKQMTMTPRAQTGVGLCPKAFFIGERKSRHPPVREFKELSGDVSQEQRKREQTTEGFIPILEREKTTTKEMETGSNVCTQYSCLKRALTDVDYKKQQGMRVSGKKIDKNPPKSSSTVYYENHNFYNIHKSFSLPPPDSPERAKRTPKSPHMVSGIYQRMEGIQTAYLDDAIYDAFDRSSTLPSIRVNKAPMKKRKQMCHPQHSQSQPSSSQSSSTSRLSHRPIYRLGVTNSLDLMSHIGIPGGVEQKLTNNLKITLHTLRRNKDSGSIIGSSFKYIPRFDHAPTAAGARNDSGIKPFQSRINPDMRHLTTRQYNNTQLASRTSSRFKSENVDSGIDSTEGFASPSKSRHISSKLQVKGLDDQDFTTNIPTETKEDQSSEAGHHDDICSVDETTDHQLRAPPQSQDSNNLQILPSGDEQTHTDSNDGHSQKENKEGSRCPSVTKNDPSQNALATQENTQEETKGYTSSPENKEIVVPGMENNKENSMPEGSEESASKELESDKPTFEPQTIENTQSEKEPVCENGEETTENVLNEKEPIKTSQGSVADRQETENGTEKVVMEQRSDGSSAQVEQLQDPTDTTDDSAIEEQDIMPEIDKSSLPNQEITSEKEPVCENGEETTENVLNENEPIKTSSQGSVADDKSSEGAKSPNLLAGTDDDVTTSVVSNENDALADNDDVSHSGKVDATEDQLENEETPVMTLIPRYKVD